MSRYGDDELLQLSGIQHFTFCKRQWALMQLEGQWVDNYHTIVGDIFHENAHGGLASEKRGDIIVTRKLPLFSGELGITGVCDVVEFHADANGVSLFGREGRFRVLPVEYKKGRPKEDSADKLQLCAQAICLEEMLLCEIKSGCLYYGEPKRRLEVFFDSELREAVKNATLGMHALLKRGHTPLVKPTEKCSSCSLVDICLPKLIKCKSPREYLAEYLKEEV